MDIENWLRELGLAQYEQAFREHAVDADTLPRLTPDDLKELGIQAIGHRRKLLHAIAHLEGATAGSVEQGPTSAGQQHLSGAAERRRLTVLFCDLVNSTALARALDPEEYGDVLGAYRRICEDAISRFSGFLAKYMGDGVLAYFGYPQAHEDEASRAVRAGLALVDEVSRLRAPGISERLQARVGIATGLVVVGDLIGTGPSQEQNVAGEPPNLAARLQSIAPPGGVVIASATRLLLGSEFDLRDLGPQKLKGFAEPVPAWKALRARNVESRFEARISTTAPLVDRAEELEFLAKRWQKAIRGEGQVVLLSGEAGIGKSRLIRALNDVHLTTEAHARVLYQCSPLFTNSPLHPVIDQVQRAAGFHPDDTITERLTKVESLLARAFVRTTTSVPLIAEMMSVPLRGSQSACDRQRQKELTLKMLAEYLIGLSRTQTLLILLEDAHWADPTTIELLDHLIECTASEHILLLITFRPEFGNRWNGRRSLSQITLNRLSPGHATELVGAVAGGAQLPRDTLAAILAKTDGVPLFIEEFTKAVLEGDGATDAEKKSSDGRRQSSIVPTTLHDSLMARLDRHPGAKTAAQLGAVIGREFQYRLLAAVSPQAEAELVSALDQLVASELVIVHGTTPDATYTFKHALVRDAAYESLLKSRRQELHTRIATALEDHHPGVIARQPELIAHHLSEAGLPNRAVPYWQMAADSAAVRQAHQETIAHCMRGLALVNLMSDQRQRDTCELHLQVRLGSSAVSVKGHSAEEVGTAFRRARELGEKLGGNHLLHPILMGLYYFHANRPDLREAEKSGRELLELGKAQNNRVVQVDGHKSLLNACYKLGKFQEARAHFESGMNLYQEVPWPKLSVEQIDDPGPHLLIIGACVYFVLGYADQARRMTVEAIALGRQRGDHLSLCHAAMLAGHLGELMDDWEAVQKSDDETLAVASEFDLAGFPARIVPRKRLTAIALHNDQKQMQSAVQHPTLSFARPLHDSVLARAYGRRGESEEGLRVIETALTWTRETGSQFFDAELYRRRANLFLLMGRIEDAESDYRSALEIARMQRARMWELKAACDLARLLNNQRRGEEALEILGPVYRSIREGFDTNEMRKAKTVLEQLQELPLRQP